MPDPINPDGSQQSGEACDDEVTFDGPDADDVAFWLRSMGEIVGHCSRCGEARDGFYTCRHGGETVPIEPGDTSPQSPTTEGRDS